MGSRSRQNIVMGHGAGDGDTPSRALLSQDFRKGIAKFNVKSGKLNPEMKQWLTNFYRDLSTQNITDTVVGKEPSIEGYSGVGEYGYDNYTPGRELNEYEKAHGYKGIVEPKTQYQNEVHWHPLGHNEPSDPDMLRSKKSKQSFILSGKGDLTQYNSKGFETLENALDISKLQSFRQAHAFGKDATPPQAQGFSNDDPKAKQGKKDKYVPNFALPNTEPDDTSSENDFEDNSSSNDNSGTTNKSMIPNRYSPTQLREQQQEVYNQIFPLGMNKMPSNFDEWKKFNEAKFQQDYNKSRGGEGEGQRLIQGNNIVKDIVMPALQPIINRYKKRK